MPTILLCMTPGVSLETWKKQGILGREIRPYLSLAQADWKIKVLTFHRELANDYGFPREVQTIYFPHRRLLGLLPYTHAWLSRSIDVLQTNQSYGAWYYTRAARRWRKPLLLRCGFVYGEGLESDRGTTKHVRQYQRLESKAFADATMIETTTTHLANWIIKRYQVAPDKIEITPNYIDTVLFRPVPHIRKEPRSVVSVGNLHSVKCFDLLVRACAIANVSQLTIFGDGPERAALLQLARTMHVNLELPGRVPNEELPGYLRKFQVYAITSRREGHPKALLEAMACGLGCIGVDVTGIRECLLESKAGHIVGANPEAIGDGITNLLDHPEMCEALGRRGREFVESTMGYPSIFSRRIKLLERCVATT